MDHTCGKCGRTFEKPSLLKKHSERKTPCEKVLDEQLVDESKPYQCKLCRRSYASTHSLNRHIRSCKARAGGAPTEAESEDSAEAKGAVASTEPGAAVDAEADAGADAGAESVIDTLIESFGVEAEPGVERGVEPSVERGVERSAAPSGERKLETPEETKQRNLIAMLPADCESLMTGKMLVHYKKGDVWVVRSKVEGLRALLFQESHSVYDVLLTDEERSELPPEARAALDAAGIASVAPPSAPTPVPAPV